MTVLPFPSRKPAEPTCFRCKSYGMTATSVGICWTYDELITSENLAARGCPGYEEES